MKKICKRRTMPEGRPELSITFRCFSRSAGGVRIALLHDLVQRLHNGKSKPSSQSIGSFDRSNDHAR